MSPLSSPTLTTTFEIDDTVPVVVRTEQPWLCFGGNQYLKSPPPR